MLFGQRHPALQGAVRAVRIGCADFARVHPNRRKNMQRTAWELGKGRTFEDRPEECPFWVQKSKPQAKEREGLLF
jgi:hypothetical protein